MTFAGAFELLYERDANWNKQSFTHKSITQGGHDQDTGKRKENSKSSQTVNGALDPVTEEDLNLYGIAQLIDGSQKFFTEASYGIEVGDIIIAPDGRKFRVHEKLALPRRVTSLMGNQADMIAFHLYLTTEGG